MALDLASIQGWQKERRRALALLTAKIERAEKAYDWPTLEALVCARIDVDRALRESATYVIEESVQMRAAHESWPHKVAA